MVSMTLRPASCQTAVRWPQIQRAGVRACKKCTRAGGRHRPAKLMPPLRLQVCGVALAGRAWPPCRAVGLAGLLDLPGSLLDKGPFKSCKILTRLNRRGIDLSQAAQVRHTILCNLKVATNATVLCWVMLATVTPSRSLTATPQQWHL